MSAPNPKFDVPAERARRLYKAPGGGGSYDHALSSAFGPAEYQARASRDHLEGRRLENQKRELREMFQEMDLRPDQALKFANGIRDTSRKPITRTQLTDCDLLHLQQKFGERYPEILAAADTFAARLMSNKPTLKETVARTHAHVHVDLVEIACEAALAHDLVNPAEPPK